MSLKVVIHEEEDGGYWAEAPSLPGCVSQGETLEELEENFREAALGCMEDIQDSLQGLKRLQNKKHFMVSEFNFEASGESQFVEIDV